MSKILLLNQLLTTLILIQISVTTSWIFQVELPKKISKTSGFEGMDDEVCQILELDECKSQSIQKLCPQKCSKSTDETFCKDLDLDNCEEPAIKKRCPQRCSTGMDDEVCKVLDLDDCKAQSIQKLCPQMCSQSTDDTFCKYLDLGNCQEQAIKKRCPQMCSAVTSSNSTRSGFDGYCGDPDCHPEIIAVGNGRPFCYTASDHHCHYGELDCDCDEGICCSPIDQNYLKCGDMKDTCLHAGKISNSAVACAINKEDCERIFPDGSYFIPSETPYHHCSTEHCGCCLDKSESDILDSVKCGLPKADSNDFTRIVNGQQVNNPNQYPWMVKLFAEEYSKNKFRCGGSLINFKYVLTAAHCFYSEIDSCEEDKPSIVMAGIGGNELLHPEPIKIPKENIVILEGYDCTTIHKDAALLELPESLLHDYLINGDKVPVCLAAENGYTFADLDGTVIGYGKMERFGPGPTDFLREAVVPVVANAMCSILKPDITPEEICTHTGGGIYAGDADICKGDSGGPLMVNGTVFATEQLQQIGISSSSTCGTRPGYVAKYTRVSAIIKEITKVAGRIWTIFS